MVTQNSNLKRDEELDLLFAQIKQGNEQARNELFEALYDRLCRMTQTVLRSFAVLRNRFEIGDLVSELTIKMCDSLMLERGPETTDDFFRFFAWKLRCLLLDEAKKVRRRGHCLSLSGVAAEEDQTDFDPQCSYPEPDRVAEIKELREQAQEQLRRLSEGEQEVVDLRVQLDLSFSKIGRILGIHEKKAGRLWQKARQQMEPCFAEM